MRRVLMMASAALLGLLLMGSNQDEEPISRACGGFTLHGGIDEDPCCVSGIVTLEGEAIKGATVVASNVSGTVRRKALDITDFATAQDPFPTYGFLLDGPELKAEPGDVIQLDVSFKDYSRTVSFVVRAGEQWLDIELAGIHSEEQLR